MSGTEAKTDRYVIEVMFADGWATVGTTDNPEACYLQMKSELPVVTMPLVNGYIVLNRSDFKAIRMLKKE